MNQNLTSIVRDFSWKPDKPDVVHDNTLCLLRSAFVNKIHRVQYEFRFYRRFMTFVRLTGSTADTFLEYIERNLPEGVALKVTKVMLLRDSGTNSPLMVTNLLWDFVGRTKKITGRSYSPAGGISRRRTETGTVAISLPKAIKFYKFLRSFLYPVEIHVVVNVHKVSRKSHYFPSNS